MTTETTELVRKLIESVKTAAFAHEIDLAGLEQAEIQVEQDYGRLSAHLDFVEHRLLLAKQFIDFLTRPKYELRFGEHLTVGHGSKDDVKGFVLLKEGPEFCYQWCCGANIWGPFENRIIFPSWFEVFVYAVVTKIIEVPL